MSPTELGESLAVLARMITELNDKLAVLPEIQNEVQQINRSILMVRGWMDGQEQITEVHARRLMQILDKTEHVERRQAAASDKIDRMAGYLADFNQKLGGVIELGQSAYDIAAETKTMVKEFVEKNGGEVGERDQATARQ